MVQGVGVFLMGGERRLGWLCESWHVWDDIAVGWYGMVQSLERDIVDRRSGWELK